MMRRKLPPVAARPKGPATEVTTTWKAAVLVRLAEMNMSHRELARRIGTTSPSISRFLNTGQRTSRYAAAIAKETDVPLPTALITDSDHARWHECGGRLKATHAEGYRDILDVLENYDVRPIEDVMRRVRIAFGKLRGSR
jgi:hypothetical protein